MAFTTYVGLVTALATMSVTGVSSTARFAYPPPRISAAQMPILYVRTPSAERETSTLGYAQGLKMATVEVVILIGPMKLDTQANNLAATVTLIDALADALEANAAALGMDRYSIAPEADTVGGDEATPYWAIVATVEVSG